PNERAGGSPRPSCCRAATARLAHRFSTASATTYPGRVRAALMSGASTSSSRLTLEPNGERLGGSADPERGGSPARRASGVGDGQSQRYRDTDRWLVSSDSRAHGAYPSTWWTCGRR